MPVAAKFSSQPLSIFTSATTILDNNANYFWGGDLVHDTIYGLGGDDYIDGGGGNDVIDGGDGNDTLYGSGGNDSLYGGAGDDWLNGGTGADYMSGGSGNDTYVVTDASDTVVETRYLNGVGYIDAGGVDLVRTNLASYTLGTNIENLTSFGTGYESFVGTGNALDNVMRVEWGQATFYGMAGNDRLFGSDYNDYLDGGADNDQVIGGYGDDVLIGGAGNDQLDFGLFVSETQLAGADQMIGGAGDDMYGVDDAGDVVVELADEGVDGVVTLLASYTLTDNVENLIGGAGGIAFTGVGNELANTIVGQGGDDTLDGLGGADTLYGAGGTDVLSGGDGDDQIVGGVGDDNLFGGSGNDYLDFFLFQPQFSDADLRGADVMAGGLGNDTYGVDNVGDIVQELSGQGVDTVATSLAAYTLTANVENLLGGSGGNFAGTGNNLANRIESFGGNDVLSGLAGNDTLIAGGGADILIGGAGRDTLNVSEDTAARDVIRYLALSDSGATTATRDTIVGFDKGGGAKDDKIDLSAIDANSALAGNQAFKFVAAFTNVAGQLAVTTHGADSIVHVDVNGDGADDLSILLKGVTGLAASDFVL